MGSSITALVPIVKKGNAKSQNMFLRQSGMSYKNCNGETVEAKQFTFISCRCAHRCNVNVASDARETTFNEFWKKGNWNRQSVFMRSCIKMVRIIIYVIPQSLIMKLRSADIW